MNRLVVNCMFGWGQVKEGEMYDVDLEDELIESEKYDGKGR